jgi:DNA (cytosine-5)-methyltransferase 1
MTARTTRPINVIDLFAGCGGLTQGFHEFRADPGSATSPFRTVGAVELDVAAASTYAANFADEAGGTKHVFAGDINEWRPDVNAPQIDMILGGPPCQGFSGLGKEDPDDPRNKLWQQYVRVVKAVNPKIFIIENVDRFMRSPEFDLLTAATDPDGLLHDYVLQYKVLNSADYGVPQARRRAIVLATHRDLIASHPRNEPLLHPAATHRRRAKNETGDALLMLDDFLPDWVPVATVFEHTETMGLMQLPQRSCEPLGVQLPGTFKTSELHIGRNPTARSLERYAAIPPGGNRHDLPRHLSTESWWNHHSGSGDVMGRLRWNEPSVTIRTEFFKPEKGRYLHPYANRPITHLEAALLQGFPQDFLWCGSKVQIARQIGNAVPVGLATALATAAYGYLNATGQLEQAA